MIELRVLLVIVTVAAAVTLPQAATLFSDTSVTPSPSYLAGVGIASITTLLRSVLASSDPSFRRPLAVAGWTVLTAGLLAAAALGLVRSDGLAGAAAFGLTGLFLLLAPFVLVTSR